MDGIEFSQSSGMRVVFIEEFAERGVNAVVEEACRVVGDGPTYISVVTWLRSPRHLIQAVTQHWSALR